MRMKPNTVFSSTHTQININRKHTLPGSRLASSWKMRSCRQQRVAGAHTRSETHTHLHGGPLQRHSTTCTALSENANVHFTEECLSVQKGLQTNSQTNGGRASIFTTARGSPLAELSEQLFNCSSWINDTALEIWLRPQEGKSQSVRPRWLKKHSRARMYIHACSQAAQPCLTGARSGQLHNLFFTSQTRRQLSGTSEQPFLINCDKWANHNQTTACESWFVTCFLRCSRLRRGLSIRTASSHSCVWDGGIRQHVDPEWNIQSILVVAPTPPPFFWRKHLKSAKYGHFPESSQPMTCTPFPERETAREGKK